MPVSVAYFWFVYSLKWYFPCNSIRNYFTRHSCLCSSYTFKKKKLILWAFTVNKYIIVTLFMEDSRNFHLLPHDATHFSSTIKFSRQLELNNGDQTTFDLLTIKPWYMLVIKSANVSPRIGRSKYSYQWAYITEES